MHKKAWWVLLLPLWLILVAAQPVRAATLPAKPAEHYYDDEIGVLDQNSQQLIDQKNQFYQTQKQKPQIGVAIVKSSGGEALGEYAPDLFKKWGIGDQSRDNGVLIVFAENSGKNNMRIEVGYGLEGDLTDALAGRILNKNLSNIKSSDPAKVNKAVVAVFNAVATVIDKKYAYPKDDNTVSMSQYQQQQQQTQRGSGVFSGVIKIIFIVVIVIIVLASIGGGGSGGGGRRRRNGGSWWLWYLLGSLLSSGRGPRGPWGGGGGGFGGGGFGGGSSWGGGSSGGGGADV
ncbi:TPM domain-containing protein [Lacticaseibacillus baoqingensis]|uniref:TPM domain-containing protein n=1 Tax=Lacticaseibacillus baoqingensis TaxID=2486013 RepID=A0ABW4E4X2_9LACO|nr:TPM domain-containing protein [Lacticaseibacillus baoqingensis]